MKKKRFTEDQIVKILKRIEAGEKVKDLCREVGCSEPTIYQWKSKYSGLELSDLKRLKAMEEENARLKRVIADQALNILVLKEANSKKW